MKPSIRFGWRAPDFPELEEKDPQKRASIFREQIFNYMDTIHGGLDSAWLGDHFFPWPPDMDQSLETPEAWTTTTYLMARYPQMRLGTFVLCQSYRQPALIAKSAAILQWLSEGRLIFGIGAGWKDDEYPAYGYDFPSDKVRLDQLEEAVQIILKMWTEDTPTFHGKYYSIENAYCSPHPYPLPPLLIGGFGPKRTLRIVAQYADWCNINNQSVDFCRIRLQTLREHCQSLGRDYDSIVKTYSAGCISIMPTHEEAVRIHQASYFSPYGPITGTPNEIAAQIQPYIDLGFTYFVFRFADFPKTEGVKLFMKEVLPRYQ